MRLYISTFISTWPGWSCSLSNLLRSTKLPWAQKKIKKEWSFNCWMLYATCINMTSLTGISSLRIFFTIRGLKRSNLSILGWVDGSGREESFSICGLSLAHCTTGRLRCFRGDTEKEWMSGQREFYSSSFFADGLLLSLSIQTKRSKTSWPKTLFSPQSSKKPVLSSNIWSLKCLRRILSIDQVRPAVLSQIGSLLEPVTTLLTKSRWW